MRADDGIEAAHRRLRVFSFVLPRPKEGEGDSLQLALRVDDGRAGRALLALLGLEEQPGVQRPTAGPFAGGAVLADVVSRPQTADAAFLEGTVVVLHLWNEAAPYEVTEALIERAAAIEQHLVALHVDALPRETRLLGGVERTPTDG